MTMDIATLGIRVDATEARLAAIELEKLSTAGGKTAQSMSAVDKATRLLAGAFAGITAIELAKNIISTNMAMESLRAQLTALTGSALGSEKAFNFIKDFATSTPFEIEGVTKSFIMLQNFGIKPTIGVMNALTNQAAKLGGAQETLAGITLALGQAYSKGKLQAEEMNQMIERGVPVYQILQELTGKNSAALQEMAHKGEITRDVMDGFIKKMGELASGGNAAAMETLRGKISNLSDAWHQFEDALLQDKSEGIMKSILDSMTFIINDFTANLNRGTGSFGEIEKINNKIIAQKETIRRLNDGQGMIPNSERPEKIAAANSELQKLLESRKIEIGKYHDVIAAENTRTEGTKKFNEAVKEKAELGKKATKTLENLTETNYKLTHSQTEYNKHTLEALGLKGEDLEKALKLANANDALSASSKGVASGTKAAAREQAQLAKSFDDTVKALSLNIVEQSQSKRQLEEATLASKLFNKAQIEQVMVIWDAKEALIAKKKLHEDEKAQLDSLIDRYNKATMSARDYYSSTLNTTSPDGIKSPMSGADKAPLLSQFDKTSKAELDKKAIDDAKTSLDAYNSSLDSANSKTSDLSAVTSAIFDGALAGINGMAGAFDSMVNSIDATTEALTKNAEAQTLNNAQADSPEKAANATKYAQVELDLNDKVLGAKLKAGSQIAGFLSSSLKKGSIEQKAAHAIQMGLAGAELAMSLMKLLGIGKVTAAETASVLPSVVASTAKGAAKASEAIATQATAGPYIGFAMMAAMAAAMAAIGFATGGGGGGGSSEPPPSNADTGAGTVLGDPAAVSESIGHTNDLLKSIHADEYIELRGINKGIQTLQGNILSAVTKEFQLGSLTGTNAPNLGKSGHTMVGGGMMTLAIALSEIIAGKDVTGLMYTTDAVAKTSKGKTSFTYQDYFSPMDKSLSESLTKVFKSVGQVMSETGAVLGKDIGVDFSQKINDSVIPALKIDTMSMTGEEAVARANAVISSMIDKLTTAVFGDVLKQYQQLGEGMLETTIRIVAEIAIVKDALHQSGLSITADVIAVSDALVQAAGGLEEFQKQFESFYDKFYTDAEKQARLAERLYGTFAELFPDETIQMMGEARANYRKVIEALDMNTQAGQAQYSMLIELASAADTYYSALETLDKGLKDYYASTIKSADDAVAKAKTALQNAYKAEQSELTATINKVRQFRDSLRSLKESLSLGALSIGTPADKYSIASQQFNDAYKLVQAGAGSTTESKAAYDKALSTISAKAQAFLEASRVYNASGSQYTADYKLVMEAIDSMSTLADTQINYAQSQLDVSIRANDLLMNIDGSVLTVANAIAALNDAMIKQGDANSGAGMTDSSFITSLYNNVLHRAPDAAGLDFWTNGLQNGTSRSSILDSFQKSNEALGINNGDSSFLTSLYNNVLHRAPDAAGFDFWMKGLQSGTSRASVTDSFKKSSEALGINGSHFNGLDFVPFDGYRAELHKGERVITAQQVKNDGAISKEIVLELRALRKEVETLRADQGKHTGALIQSNYDANDLASSKIVKSTEETTKKAAWISNSKVVIA